MITYIDGPFFPPEGETDIHVKQKALRDQVYDHMVELSKNSDVEVIKYVRKEAAYA